MILLNNMKKRVIKMEKGTILDNYNGMTQMEVAEELGFSQQYIQQIEKSALRKFRKNYIKIFGLIDMSGLTDEEFLYGVTQQSREKYKIEYGEAT